MLKAKDDESILPTYTSATYTSNLAEMIRDNRGWLSALHYMANSGSWNELAGAYSGSPRLQLGLFSSTLQVPLPMVRPLKYL